MQLKEVRKLLDDGLYADAISRLETALSSSPGFYLYYQYLASAYLAIGDMKSALASIEFGLALNPESVSLIKSKRDLQDIDPQLRNEAFAGIYDEYPITSSVRYAEGGLRTQGVIRSSTSDQPLVSIVTVVYNNSTTLERCIESVRSQEYKNIEYIIIDGGSDEETLNIIESHAQHIDYYISEDDRGIYNAMNKGIQVSKGDFIALLNSDDVYSPKFVAQSIKYALAEHADITYTNYCSGDTKLIASNISDGVMLGHLNICHNTFLVSKSCYDSVGPYDPSFKIVSDAIWIRKAYRLRKKFIRVDQDLFILSEGGLSSGSSEEHRSIFIGEVVKSYIKQFGFLSEEEAEELYLLRFNNKRLVRVLEVAQKNISQRLFLSALGSYIQHCFSARDSFRLSRNDSDSHFPVYVRACNMLQIDRTSIRIVTKRGCLSNFLKDLEAIIETRKGGNAKTILHFASVFSAPSETFIYDLIVRLESSSEYDNFVLFEHHKLEQERVFSKRLYVPWNDFSEEVRSFIYEFVFDRLRPNVIVAHFALNEWKLNQRIAPLGIRVPTLTMTHGIDVFMLRSEKEYREYILNNFALRNDTKFTTVSGFLLGELLAQGVPEEKIAKISNTANPRFFSNRKSGGYYDYKRNLRILSLGRCIELKGQIDLLHGFKWFLDNVCSEATLTIVYGNGIDNLPEVQATIESLSLSENVELKPYVNFTDEPTFYTNFDIYIQPSKYSKDGLKRTEAFGVAALEAILSGLPVIVTNAGGLPEVVGDNGTYSRIVNYDSPIEIGEALEYFFDRPETFSSNFEYAKSRLDLFSEQNQITSISKELRLLTSSAPRVAMFSTSTAQGAGYAAFRLFRGLRQLTHINPTLYTTVRNHEREPDVIVVKHPSGDNRRWNLLQEPDNSKPGLTIFTINDPLLSNRDIWEMVKDFDVINIHWVARFLSIENIAFLTSLGKPVIMTVRDMQPITGGCHFFHGCDEWTRACASCPQLIDTFDDIPSKILQAKRQTYNFENLTVVALSNHTREIISRTPLFNNCRIEVIPNSIEVDIFKPTDRCEARRLLGLPLDRKIVAYIPSFFSEVKGYREIVAAFAKLRALSDTEEPLVILMGNQTPADSSICFESVSLGYIEDSEKLALAYSAADLVVVPSLEETFSNTTAEAISCGTPVVGFRTGAIPDLVVAGVSGYTYEIGDIDGLAEGIRLLLSKPLDADKCRQLAVSKLEFHIQAKRYEELICELSFKSGRPLGRLVESGASRSDMYIPVINRLASRLLTAES